MSDSEINESGAIKISSSSQAEVSASLPENSPLLDALERFIEFVDEIYDNPKPRFHQWEGNVDQVAVRSVGRILSKWKRVGSDERPPHTLIVRLTNQLPAVLKDVVDTPKRRLQRRRAMQPLARLREMDSSCIRWVSRQPGRTLDEKAGHRRSLLAVERFESLDTLENRVVLALLQLCIAASRNYLRKFQARFSTHDRVKSVIAFARLCQQLAASPLLREVSSIKTAPKPNYVLLHDSRYHQIWRAYLDIVRQHRRRQLLWMYRERVYGEMAFLTLISAVSTHVASGDSRSFSLRHDIGLRRSLVDGSVFDRRLSTPMWSVEDREGVRVDLPRNYAAEGDSGEHGLSHNAIVLTRLLDGREKVWRLEFSFPADGVFDSEAPAVLVRVFSAVEAGQSSTLSDQFRCNVNLPGQADALSAWVAEWIRQ